jgi:hypothetical protein
MEIQIEKQKNIQSRINLQNQATVRTKEENRHLQEKQKQIPF